MTIPYCMEKMGVGSQIFVDTFGVEGWTNQVGLKNRVGENLFENILCALFVGCSVQRVHLAGIVNCVYPVFSDL